RDHERQRLGVGPFEGAWGPFEAPEVAPPCRGAPRRPPGRVRAREAWGALRGPRGRAAVSRRAAATAGARPSAGGLGGPSRPPRSRCRVEARRGDRRGASERGGLGGPFEAPEVALPCRGAPRRPPGRVRARGAWGALRGPPCN